MRTPKLRFRRPSPALVISIIALVVATSGVTFAATIGSDKVVYACVSGESLREHGDSLLGRNSDGVVVVTDPARCETAVEGGWAPDAVPLNAPGPQGPQGVAGAPGAPGAAGAQGPAGPAQQTPPKVSPAEATKIAEKLKQTETKIEAGSDKLDKLKDTMDKSKSSTQLQKQIELMMDVIRQMLVAILSQQQTQQQTLGQVSTSIAVGNAASKLKEAEKAADKAGDAQKKLDGADTAKEQQKALDEMIKQILRFMQQMQEAQSEQMKALTRP